ncbi:U2 small nuclear ribonucleoprotein A'-like [Varroa jacobsoni]|uniref:Probable U2 small nuclear ribonucleoprotein A' n=1 Tax=Varroa destructor TaxID=109461 RepID=A0A7M7K0T1_VARDE|nr:U2 small nuclear ribonucleoprotein A'-like [Varroa destructor]XP_022698550.1 U2 small nuclear ribonucleoprotein A'-like [Varroa jacobsoni]
MVRLTVDIVQGAAQYINPVKERELDLRGYRLPEIENLGATLDQFDTIDFSDNDIRKLEGFPFLKRIKSLLFNNNRICRITENLEEQLPSLESLIMTNNQIQNLGDLDSLATVKSLRYLSVLKNPVALKKHYRLYIVHKIPQLRILDFKRIKMTERDEARKMFKGKKGEAFAKEIGLKSAPEKAKTFVPGEPAKLENTFAMTPEDQQAIKEAIGKATTLDEIERLTQLLRSGQLPNKTNESLNGKKSENTEEVEEDEGDNEMET